MPPSSTSWSASCVHGHLCQCRLVGLREDKRAEQAGKRERATAFGQLSPAFLRNLFYIRTGSSTMAKCLSDREDILAHCQRVQSPGAGVGSGGTAMARNDVFLEKRLR